MTQSRTLAQVVNRVDATETATTSNDVQLARGNNHGKNLIINGDFSVWQRGTSAFGTGVYSADRWFNQFGITSADRTTSNIPTTAQYGLQINRSTTGAAQIEQRIESLGAALVVGRELTFSFYNDVSSGTLDSIDVYLITADATDNWAAATVRETVSIASPTDGGVNTVNFSAVHADAANGFEIRISYNVTGNTTVTIAQAQLEFGDTATDFEYVNPADQLARCQRYFERLGGTATTIASGHCESTTNAHLLTRYISKRSVPSVTYPSTISNYVVTIAGSNPNASSITASNIGVSSCNTVPVTTGLTTGQGAGLYLSTDTYIDIDAEL